MFNPDGYMPNSMVEPYDLEKEQEILNSEIEEEDYQFTEKGFEPNFISKKYEEKN